MIRYWSFYQVLEYFFPHFDKQVAVAELTRFLRNPLFDPHDEESVLNVAELASSVSNNVKNEEEQLYTTLRSVVSELEVKRFIRDHELEEHLSDKNSELSTVRIQVSREEDILRRLAARIYAIRCGIVHSKSTNSKGAGSGLLPGTHHDDLILIELPLIEFLAQQALLKTATKFQI
ncbi:hypothetical protein A6F49_02250 [Enteractinococcus helveticum]|uniref:Apea-like HEPN domain-containing protein n=1 Tax=Enteractinococcus helveticum TaxID=1837282 RepID=A0A1B7LUN8_9MICC|nr:hypothetical protein A6F49_02250 [Enteractinococcus helveticum]